MIQYMTKHNPIWFVLPWISEEQICEITACESLNTVIWNGSGMPHILNWQTDGDYCKDNALHMSNDLQIIYVTFRSIIVFAEDINCVTNIKLPAKRAELSFLLSENTEPSAPRQTCVRPSFVQHLTQCEGFLLEMPTCVADDVCVSSVLWLPGPRRCAAPSPHQFHKPHS